MGCFLLTDKPYFSYQLTMRTTRKQINQKQIARRAEIGADFFSHILHGRRPCPKGVALRLEAVTGIDRNLWIWGSPEEMRQAVTGFMYRRGSHGS